MQKTKKQKAPQYGALPHHVITDPELSLKAKGLLLYISDKPDDWRYSSFRVAKETSDGRDAIRFAFRELEIKGYVARKKRPDGSILVVSSVARPKAAKRHGGVQPRWKKPTVGKSVPSHIHRNNTYIENTHTENNTKRLSHVDENAMRLACLLKTRISENYPNHRFSGHCEEDWALEIDRMHRIDRRSWEEIEGAINWSANDHFWRKNIWSGKALRKQYDRLYAQAKANREHALRHGVIEV